MAAKTVTYRFIRVNHCQYIGQSQKYEYWRGPHKKYKIKRAYAEKKREIENTIFEQNVAQNINAIGRMNN